MKGISNNQIIQNQQFEKKISFFSSAMYLDLLPMAVVY